MIAGKTLGEWQNEIPLIREMIQYKELFWENNQHHPFESEKRTLSIKSEDVQEAQAMLERFAPYIAKAFPETKENKGLIESPLKRIPCMKKELNRLLNTQIKGSLLLKCDNLLPISGSIKARGGIFEVLKHAEDIAFESKMLKKDDDYSVLMTESFRQLFSKHELCVGSTGNLGLSIGIMGARLGFQVSVHMSADAQDWKKDLLRTKGVEVIEYDSDYSKAVEEGRKLSESNANSYFVDDENSINLFLGYAVAGKRLQKQLDQANITVDETHPLFVYLPCGVGGGPGGVAFGLKMIYGDNVHVFFAEPTHSPCMMLGMITQKHDEICVQDFGIDNITCADGLAVGRSSSFIGKTLERTINGFFTVSDENLFRSLSLMQDSEAIKLEPSALAGMVSIVNFHKTDEINKYAKLFCLRLENITHLAWATGGNMVPKDIMESYYEKGAG